MFGTVDFIWFVGGSPARKIMQELEPVTLVADLSFWGAADMLDVFWASPLIGNIQYTLFEASFSTCWANPKI